MAAAFFPESRTIPSAPWPGGVAIAAIVSSILKANRLLQKTGKFNGNDRRFLSLLV
jgi:hypothetical protein